MDNSTRINFLVPTETVPALIGLQGQKHRDTQLRSNTRISIEKSSELLTRVEVQGSRDNCCIAQQLIFLSVKHHLASLRDLDQGPVEVGRQHAALDLKTILFEIHNLKC